MTSDRPWEPQFRHVRDTLATEPLRLRERIALPGLVREEFAGKVVRRLITAARVCVIAEHGRPALVNCAEQLYELLAKDHPIVGVYTAGARVRDIIDDLEAAGL